jgi:hypothetical protein
MNKRFKSFDKGLICYDCACELKAGQQWDESSLGNTSEHCDLCGKTENVREVVLLSKFILIMNPDEKYEPQL